MLGIILGANVLPSLPYPSPSSRVGGLAGESVKDLL